MATKSRSCPLLERAKPLPQELGGIGVTGSNQSNDDLRRLVDQVLAAWGRIDVLMNSAGHGPREQILENHR